MKMTIKGMGNGLFMTNEQVALRRMGERSEDGKRDSIFYGGRMAGVDSLTLRRRQAQEQAMKLVKDVFAMDQQLDESLENTKVGMERLKQENLAYYKRLRDIPGRQEALRESYGVEEDSQEQMDLELLRKGRAASQPWNQVTLTDEEMERLEQMQGLTDYQRDSLALDSEKELYETYIEKNDLMIEAAGDMINDTRKERLKEHPMVDAQEQAGQIEEAARMILVGDLFGEGLEHIQEAQEEEERKAEEKTEEEKEQEERIQEQKERNEEQQEIIEEVQDQEEKEVEVTGKMKADKRSLENVEIQTEDGTDDSVGRRLAKILDKLKLLEEDLKGAGVDVSL